MKVDCKPPANGADAVTLSLRVPPAMNCSIRGAWADEDPNAEYSDCGADCLWELKAVDEQLKEAQAENQINHFYFCPFALGMLVRMGACVHVSMRAGIPCVLHFLPS